MKYGPIFKYLAFPVLVFFLASLFFAGGAFCLELKSPAFKDGEVMPAKYTCMADNVSPELSWSGAPSGTRSFVLIVDDPDATMGTWVHWVVYDIPWNVSKFKEDIPKGKVLLDGTKQGVNSFRWIGYGGPCPPPGPAHRYIFTLYAVDTDLDIPEGAQKGVVLKSIQGHILEETKLTGLFKR